MRSRLCLRLHARALDVPDALVEMARLAMAVPAGARLPEPLFTTLVGYQRWEELIELASGTVISPAALLPWLDQAYIERVVFDGPDRVMSVGRRQRLFSGATRRAVETRDRECYHPYCEEPAERCDVDHVIPYPKGGHTTESNGRSGCHLNNEMRNRSP